MRGVKIQNRFCLKGAIFLIICFFTSSVFAEIIKLKNGKEFSGTVVSIQDEVVTIQLDTRTSIAFKYDDIEPLYLYNILAHNVGQTDADAHLSLAEFCVSNDLFKYAIIELNAVLRNDPQNEAYKKRLEEVKIKLLNYRISKAEEYITKGDYKNSIEILTQLVEQKPDVAYLNRINDLLKQALEIKKEALKADEEKKKREKEEKIKQKLKKMEEKVLKQYQEASSLIEQAKQFNAKALSDEGNQRYYKAVEKWGKGIQLLIKAKSLFIALQKQVNNDILIETISNKLDKVDQLLAFQYASVGFTYLLDGDYYSTISWVNKALSIDPNNEYALRLKTLAADLKVKVLLEKLKSEKNNNIR